MSPIYWCARCKVPLLARTCDICGTRSRARMAPDIAPVFKKEMAFLRTSLGWQGLSPIAPEGCLWSAGQRYFYDGKPVASVSHKESEVRLRVAAADAKGRLPLATGLGRRRLLAKFAKANRTHVEKVTDEAASFIRNCMQDHPRHVPVVAFSGGKDSTVVSHLVRQALGRADILHLMSDTTIEAPHTYQYVRAFRKGNPQVPVVVLQPAMSFWDMAGVIGPPSRIIRWCCSSHKAAPMASVVLALRVAHAGVLTFDGIRATESARRKSYERVTYRQKIAGEVLASPIRDWRDADVWAYIIANRLSFNEGYRRGFRRMGCLPCPFNSRWSEVLIAANYPEEYRRWRTFLTQHAATIGHPRAEQYAADGWRVRAGGRGMARQLAPLQKEVCLRTPNAFGYAMPERIDDVLLEFLKPFGAVMPTYDDGLILKAELIQGTHTRLCRLKVVRSQGTIRVEYGARKNLRLLIQRVERQLKKYMACIHCGSCAASCPTGALQVNERYRIDASMCRHCLECVKVPCVAVE